MHCLKAALTAQKLQNPVLIPAKEAAKLTERIYRLIPLRDGSLWVEKNVIGPSNLDEMAQAAKSGYEGSYVFRNIEFIGEAESITVDGKDAKKLGFNYETSQASGGKKMKRVDVFLLLGEDFYTIVFEDTSDHFDKLAGDFKQILESISFD
jgi:hypothetical protein